MPTISSPGVGTGGLDLAKMLDDLRKYEMRALVPLDNAKKITGIRISAFGQLSAAVTALQSAAEKMGHAANENAVKVTVTGDAFKATGSPKAVTGQYTVQVVELAQSQVLQSGAVDRTTPLGQKGDTLNITLANGKSQRVTLGDDTSLSGIASAINACDQAGVIASLVNTQDGKSVLMLSSKDSGTDSAVASIAVEGSSTLSAALSYDSSGTGDTTLVQQTQARNATVVINGLRVTGSSNTLTQPIDGLTLTLLKPSEVGTTPNLTVSTDPAATKQAATGFVTAYNNLLAVIAKVTHFDPATKASSALTADSTTRTIQETVAAALRFVSPQGDLKSLAQVGITTDPKTGSLKIDTAALDSALEKSPADTARLFGGENGLGKRMASATEALLGNKAGMKGAISVRTESLVEQEKKQDQQIETVGGRIEVTMANYSRQFAALSKTMALFESTNNYLKTQFEMMARSK